jgi:hypothetical protein
VSHRAAIPMIRECSRIYQQELWAKVQLRKQAPRGLRGRAAA